MKKILGLDLGSASIGWALVNEAENDNEESSIIKLGVRVNPLTVDELTNFEKGKSITTNADRTLKRSMRRNLQRYKLRKENLINILIQNGWINDQTILSENGNKSTFETYRLRAKAATDEVSLYEFARVLLMINRKRGYKSSRKAKSTDEGLLIDGMEIAKRLYHENLTPGQLVFDLIIAGKKYFPDFYRSDLQTEFDRIWDFQKQFYPDVLTDEFKKQLAGKGKQNTAKIFLAKYGIYTAANKGENKKLEATQWRVDALSKQLSTEELAFVISDLNGNVNNSSGYLGAISDRSKELYFNKQTVGQYLMDQLAQNPHARLKNQVFYRQDYLDEFNTLWETQAKFHNELTSELKSEICDVIIFFQRRLKSQKGLISFCEFESKQIEVEVDGKKKLKTIGMRVCPKSSPLFQEFKIWQRLNDIEVFPLNEKNKKHKPNARKLDKEEKELLFSELSVKEKLKKDSVLSLLDLQEMDMNFNDIEGNRTNYELFKAYKEIVSLSGHEIDDENIIESIAEIFKGIGVKTDFIYFDSEKLLDDQTMYKLWHLLYSFEGDNSKTGSENLIDKISLLTGFEKEYARIISGVTFNNDYGSLSAKAIRKILPHLRAGERYDIACVLAGYGKHSASSLTKEELRNKEYKTHLTVLPKNSLRNPVVEKILNQLINLINTIIETSGIKDDQGNILELPFDEVRIELARELKKNADERLLLTDSVGENTRDSAEIRAKLQEEFGISNPSRNDIIRYKLWKELAPIGYKPLYSSKENRNREISPAILFSKDIEIEHILPKARLFDDSQSNKTLVFHSDNQTKSNKTAIDYIKEVDGESGLEEYLNKIIQVCGKKTIKKVVKNSKGDKSITTEIKTFDFYRKEYEKTLKKKEARIKWESLSETEKLLSIINKYYSGKLKKLTITGQEIPDGFINRDLANTQYITKYAKTMLGDLVKFVINTTGSITDRLRDDWQLVDVMKELNWDKYEKLGLTEITEEKDYNGRPYKVKKIKDWTKRNDHRHHAMDALTVAFTKRSYVQYLNNLNARRLSDDQSISNRDREDNQQYSITSEDVVLTTNDVMGIEKNELYRDDKGKLRFNPPMPLDEFRAEAKRQLENTLISIKAKNKVTTININKTKKAGGNSKKKQLTPRGQLHLETVYGSMQQPVIKEEKVGGNFNEAMIAKVTKPIYREALLKRLLENNNDPKKAFTGKNSLEKKPIFLDVLHTLKVPEKVKTQDVETIYTIRKDVSPDLRIDKVIDKKIQKILQDRLKEFNNDPKKAFTDLDVNPIWLNKERGISIKRVTITGVSNALALHDKKDKDGNLILDKEGKPQPVDFVNTGNNHHVAIYRDEKGNIQENVISFFEATERVSQGLPIIDKTYKNKEGWEFLFSMKQNEYFVFPNTEIGFNPNEIDLLDPEKYSLISPNLFRVQKFTVKDYFFRHHLETNVEMNSALKGITWLRNGLNGIEGIVKVRVNHIGQIVSIGEY